MKVKCLTCQHIIENNAGCVFVDCECGDLTIFEDGSMSVVGLEAYIEVMKENEYGS